ncbi:MAG TPA: hypothetical protein VG125_24540 [Pirellulales bacterium]|nr:hypothetical protein [Pirellulales bacterium]
MTEIPDKPKYRITAVAAWTVAASMSLFVASLPQDAFYIDRADDPRAWSLGFGLLLVGWLAVLDGVPAWLANPAVLAAWILLLVRFRRTALVMAALALLLALSFLLCDRVLTDEAGGRSRVTGYGSGYWCWVGSMAVAFFASMVDLSTRRR